MADQQFNLKFVAEIEKHEVLYNYRLPGYSNKDQVDREWSKVSAQVNLPVSECREKWKNLRTVFMRKMKPPASGSGARKKAYYLENAMQFCLPFMKTVAAPPASGNYPPVPSTTDEADTDNTRISQFQPTSEPVQDPHERSSQTNLNQSSTSSKRKKSTPDLDRFVAAYFKAKKARLDEKTVRDKKINRQEALKMFLLSLLPELEELSDTQIKFFKRRVFDILDEISTTHYHENAEQDQMHGVEQMISIQSETTSNSETTELYNSFSQDLQEENV